MYILFVKYWRNCNKKGIQYRFGCLNDANDDIEPVGSRISSNDQSMIIHDWPRIGEICANTHGLFVHFDCRSNAIASSALMCDWSTISSCQSPRWKFLSTTNNLRETNSKNLHDTDLHAVLKSIPLVFCDSDIHNELVVQQQLEQAMYHPLLQHQCRPVVALIVGSYVFYNSCAIVITTRKPVPSNWQQDRAQIVDRTSHRLVLDMISGTQQYLISTLIWIYWANEYNNTGISPEMKQHNQNIVEFFHYFQLHMNEFNWYPFRNGTIILRKSSGCTTTTTVIPWIHEYHIYLGFHIIQSCGRILIFQIIDDCGVFLNADLQPVLHLPVTTASQSAARDFGYHSISLHRDRIFVFGPKDAFLIDGRQLCILDRFQYKHHPQLNMRNLGDISVDLIHLPDSDRIVEKCDNYPLHIWSFDHNRIHLVRSFPHLKQHSIDFFTQSSLYCIENINYFIQQVYNFVPVISLCHMILEYSK